jgi:hypothetical protein
MSVVEWSTVTDRGQLAHRRHELVQKENLGRGYIQCDWIGKVNINHHRGATGSERCCGHQLFATHWSKVGHEGLHKHFEADIDPIDQQQHVVTV